MKPQLDSCNPDQLRLLAEDLLPPAGLARLEEHLERCAECRETLDRLVDTDRCLTAARRYLADDLTAPFTTDEAAQASLDFLAPSDWPDSLGRLGAYEVKGVLGRGGMGMVLKAFDPAYHGMSRSRSCRLHWPPAGPRAGGFSARQGPRPPSFTSMSSACSLSSSRWACRSW